MKFSVIVSTLNEENTITPLLDSLFDQSLLPNEVIFVDGGSNDKTNSIINDYIKFHEKTNIRIIKAPGANRSTARNIGINEAKNDHIAVTDAGCEVNIDWLKELSESFLHKGVDTVAGFYIMETTSELGKVFANYLGVVPSRLDEKVFLPSSRSIAFTKTAWEKEGKYPENLETCEDLVFAIKLKQNTKMVVNPMALVSWKIPGDWNWFFRKISGYAVGDVRAGYKPHLKKIATVFLRYLIFVPFYPLFFLYLVYSWNKNREYGIPWYQKISVQLVSDAAVIVGSVKGFIKKYVEETRR